MKIPILLLFVMLLIGHISFAQSKVKGVITDENNKPIDNVSVVKKGTSTGTITNFDGTFSLPASAGDVLEISSIGYSTVTITVPPDLLISVKLVATDQDMSDVVVIGYGTTRRKDLTGSVAVVDTRDLKSQPAASPVEALQGKATGVQIVNDGSPGGTPQIRIRGFSTINNNDPLFIIDGMPYTGKLSWLNSEDIESLQVLKDASAASIYGSRANNGVVIITTKKGRTGPPKVALDVYYGTQRANQNTFPKYLTPQQYAEFYFTQLRNAGLAANSENYGTDINKPKLPEYLIAGLAKGLAVTAADADPAKYMYSQDPETFYQITKANQAGTNWLKEITQAAPIANYQLTVTGGGENSNYALSGGYFDQVGIVKHTGFKRYTIRANSNFVALNNRLTIGENMMYSATQSQGFATNPNTPGAYMNEGSPIAWAYRIQTIIPVYDIKGNFGGTRGSQLGNAENPLAVLYRAKDNIWISNQFFGSAYADLKVMEGLNLKTTYGIRYENWGGKTIAYPNPEFAEGSFTNNTLNESNGYAKEWTWTNTATYKMKYDKHDFTLMAGTEAVKNQYRSLSGTGQGFFIFGDLDYYYLDAASTNKSSGSNGGYGALFSLFARADYNYANKYLLSATFRRDGSSAFGPENRYGNFPAASVAWRISNEEFAKSATWLNDLKLRAGYGITGNQSIPLFQYMRRFQSSINTASYPITGNGFASGLWTSNYENTKVKWEQVASLNVGLDFSILNNVLDGSIDWYDKKTSDMLYPVPRPTQGVGGGSSPFVNIGNMRNTGFEIALNYHYKPTATTDEFRFDVGAFLSRNVNTLISLAPTVTEQIYGQFRSISTSILRPGLPFGTFFGYKIVGIYKDAAEITKNPSYTGARIGGPIYADVSGADGKPDGKIDQYDRTVIGNPHPDFIYSMSFNASYKRFDLSFFLNGSQGNDIFDATRYYTDFAGFDGAVSTRMLDAWSPQNPSSMTPSPYRSAPSIELQANSYYIQDGSYLRLKNLQLGYTFDAQKMFGKYISAFRIYGSVSNLFTMTKYTGLDPEVTQFSSTFSAPGVDLGVYPASRQFIAGMNVTF